VSTHKGVNHTLKLPADGHPNDLAGDESRSRLAVSVVNALKGTVDGKMTRLVSASA
jgi:hypothetical protein